MAKPPDNPILSAADLEFEFARLVLAVHRKVETAGSAGDAAVDPAFAQWFRAAASALVARVEPDTRPYAIERLQQIAEKSAGLEIQSFDFDVQSWSFVPRQEDPPRAHG